MMGCLAAAHAATAQETDNVTVDVGECTDLESPEERFACYEARVEAELRKRDPAAVAAGAERPADAAPPAQTTDEEPREIVSTVAAFRETVPNSYVITLENGQVWRQTFAERYSLRVGQSVTLSPTRWGKRFRLSAEGSNSNIQVERVR